MRYVSTVLLCLAVAGFAFAAGSNINTIDQTGDSHVATVTQDGTTNNSDVDQTGKAGDVGTKTTVSQTGTSNASVVNMNDNHIYTVKKLESSIQQTGQQNNSNVKMLGISGLKATVIQNGYKNNADVDILQTKNEYNDFTRIEQIGDQNYAKSLTSGSSSLTSEIYQNGDHNSGVQDLKSTFISAKIDQDGHWNNATQTVTSKKSKARRYGCLMSRHAG